MGPNQVTASDELAEELVELDITNLVAATGDEGVDAEQLSTQDQMRYAELRAHYNQLVDDFLAETISATLIEVVERQVVTGGSEKFSIEKVVDESMAKLESTLGPPLDREAARNEIRAYIEEVHGLPRAGSAGPRQES
ncbi:hypothetical protein [Brachybacterium fresconis]|uniref:Uncharacterized protein YaaR (DUF327 family) n=1 Tax=Brachybacterium fresconis TaxID=173363 RepID=A0ABS4YF56_9MICO|nr:hypothetical protein [Brachybacterium fresconis]MBP2407359.1 uncharacterized protein YaaR (DUF327 family) [Brachybacterium fresconis]